MYNDLKSEYRDSMREVYSRQIDGELVVLAFHPNIRATDFAPGNCAAFTRLFAFVASNGGNYAYFQPTSERYSAEIMRLNDPIAGCGAASFVGIAHWHVPSWYGGLWKMEEEEATPGIASEEEEATAAHEGATTPGIAQDDDDDDEEAMPAKKKKSVSPITTSRYIYEIYIGAKYNPVYVYRTARGLQNRLDAICNDDDSRIASCDVFCYEVSEGAIENYQNGAWSMHEVRFARCEYGRGWATSSAMNPIPGCISAHSTNGARLTAW